MFTSNFARLKRLPKEGKPVCIAIGAPRWYRGERYTDLAPAREMLSLPRAEFDLEYSKILQHLDPEQVYEDLGENAIMLCWETPNTWCHRRRAAEWLEDACGILIPEFSFEREDTLQYVELEEAKKKTKKPSSQSSLF
ncbi:MAG: hypothetical protein WC911_03620 [Thermoleophilia bacterium]